MIKLINHQKREEHERELQASISPSIFHQISTSTPPWTRNWKRKRKNLRETREREVSWQSIRLNLKLRCLQTWRTHRFIGQNFVTVRSFRSTVTMERSIVDRFENIVAVRSRWTVQMWSLEKRYKTPSISPLRSWSNGRDASRTIKSRPL